MKSLQDLARREREAEVAELTRLLADAASMICRERGWDRQAAGVPAMRAALGLLLLDTPPWAAARRQRQLELGGVIVTLRKQGQRWTDLAAKFGLADENAARRLAVGYLVALTEPREAAQEGAGDVQNRAVAEASDAAPGRWIRRSCR